jgi:uncharacterized membrane protein YphA (DoxX/SURF4 family)
MSTRGNQSLAQTSEPGFAGTSSAAETTTGFDRQTLLIKERTAPSFFPFGVRFCHVWWRSDSIRGRRYVMTDNTEQNGQQRIVDTAWWTLRVSFGLVPFLAGLDKFFNLLVDWPKYIAPVFSHAIPLSPQGFMYIVGVIEMVAGLAVLLTPWTKQFAYVVAAWLTCIAINLIAGRFFDIAVRDLVMAASAVTLARLTDVVEVPSVARKRYRPVNAPV